MDIVVIVKMLKKFADFGFLFVRQLRDIFGNVTHFAGDDCPTIFGEPLRDEVNRGAVGNETSARCAFGDIVILLMSQRFDLIGPGFDGSSFDVTGWIFMMRLDETNMIEEKFVTAGGTELALFEEDTDFGCCAIVIVGEDLDDDRDFVGRISFEGDMLETQFVAANASAFVDRAFDGVTRDAFLAGFFHRGEQAGIPVWIGATMLGSNRNFSQELSTGLRFS